MLFLQVRDLYGKTKPKPLCTSDVAHRSPAELLSRAPPRSTTWGENVAASSVALDEADFASEGVCPPREAPDFVKKVVKFVLLRLPRET